MSTLPPSSSTGHHRTPGPELHPEAICAQRRVLTKRTVIVVRVACQSEQRGPQLLTALVHDLETGWPQPTGQVRSHGAGAQHTGQVLSTWGRCGHTGQVRSHGAGAVTQGFLSGLILFYPPGTRAGVRAEGGGDRDALTTVNVLVTVEGDMENASSTHRTPAVLSVLLPTRVPGRVPARPPGPAGPARADGTRPASPAAPSRGSAPPRRRSSSWTPSPPSPAPLGREKSRGGGGRQGPRGGAGGALPCGQLGGGVGAVLSGRINVPGHPGPTPV